MPPEGEQTKQRIHIVMAIAMIIVAFLIDVVQALLELIPAAGILFGWFMAVFAFIVFGFWFMLVGVSYLDRNGAVKIVISLASCVVELIPLIHMIPALTLGVVSLILITRAEDGKTPFLFNLAAKRQAAMSDTQLMGSRAHATAALMRDAKSKASQMTSNPLERSQKPQEPTNKMYIRQRAGGYSAPTLRDYEEDTQNKPEYSDEQSREAA